MVVGCYLARHGIAVGQGALDYLKRLRRFAADANQHSPETAEQAEMVRQWKVGE
jgi:negative regulator of replication initiation